MDSALISLHLMPLLYARLGTAHAHSTKIGLLAPFHGWYTSLF